MELDFSFTLIRSVPVVKNSSKRNKQKQVSGNCGTVTDNSTNKKETSTLSLSRRKRYQNSMKENKELNENLIKDVAESKITDISSRKSTGRSVLSDISKSSDNTINCSSDTETLKLTCKIDNKEEDKENLSPVEKDTLVMNTNAPLKNNSADSSIINFSKTESHLNNFSIGNKNSSSSSVECVDLKKVSIRRHQFQSYKQHIRNDKLYFYKRKKNILKEDCCVTNNDNERCVSGDTSLTSAQNVKKGLKVPENKCKSILKDTSLRKSSSVKNCCDLSIDNKAVRSSRSSLTASISDKLNDVSLSNPVNSSTKCIFSDSECNLNSNAKGIKRSITVARNGFKKCEKGLNSSTKSLDTSDNLCFYSCTKNKGSAVCNDESIKSNDQNCSFKSALQSTNKNRHNDSTDSVNKNLSFHHNSRLSGVAVLLTDDNDDSVVSSSYIENPSDRYLRSKKSSCRKQICMTENNKDLTKHDNISQDMFNDASKGKFCSSSKARGIKEDLSVNKSFTKTNNKKTNLEICSDVNSPCKAFAEKRNTLVGNDVKDFTESNSKTLKNVSLNSSIDFESSIINSSTPQTVTKRQSQCSYRKTLRNRIRFKDDDHKINENDDQEKQIPLSLPLPSYESPLLSKSKVKDITKWLTETEKCKQKNPFDTSDSNNEELSVSPPLINKKHKSSHFVTSTDSKVRSMDVRTPDPLAVDRMRKPLTEPNKVNPASNNKPRSVQKKRSSKKEQKKLDFSSDSDEMNNPAARILDQLYGQSWRSLNVLPASEPRNLRQKPPPVVHPPMTERKTGHKSSMFSSSSSSEDHFEEFLEKTRLKRLELTKKRAQLNKIHESSFIDETLSDHDASLTLYQKLLSTDIKKEIDVLSDSKWSGKSHNSGKSGKSSKKQPRRLSFGSTKGSENTDSSNYKSNVSSKKNRKGKKKSPDKIIKRHLPINTSHHHSSDSSGKKKKRKISKKKTRKELKRSGDNKILVNDPVAKNAELAVPDGEKNVIAVEPKTPKLIKDSAERLDTPIAVDNLKTPNSKSNVVFPATPRHTLSFLSSLSVVTANLNCHPYALMYKKNYKTKKEELSRKLFMLYNKEVFESKLPDNMLLQWNGRMRSTSGFCYNRRLIKNNGEVQRTSRIVLSSKILDTPDRLRDTLIHEMCHAATWIINGVSDGHGPRWKYWASKAMLRFPELPKIKRCHDYDIKTKYTYRCTGCGYSFGRHSKSLDTERKRCGYCYGKFELLVNVKEKRQGNGRGGATPVSSIYSDASTRTPKPVTGFALFVKENYSEVKKSNSALPHKDVMKLLGQKFSDFKFSQNNNNKETPRNK